MLEFIVYKMLCLHDICFSELMALIITTKKNLLNTCTAVHGGVMLWYRIVAANFIFTLMQKFNNFKEKF